MGKFILGLIPTLLVGLYLGFYLVKLRSLPLAIIFVAVFALVLFDFIKTIRNSQNGTQK